ncbi:MAG: hypothetical protein KTR26_08820 [Flammeovirgaceae bacterium]|nr:hypothetical protein [Flammeovirgaceae bacterium]
MLNYYLTLILGLLLASQLFAQNEPIPDYDFNHKIPVEQLREDFVFYISLLEKHHPGLFKYQTEKEWEEFLLASSAQINCAMTEHDFFSIISKVNAKIRCGHSYIKPSATHHYFRDTKLKLFPIDIKVIEGKIIIEENFSEFPFETGSEILAINGIKATKLMGELKKHVPSDGFSETGKHHELDNWFWLYYSFQYGYPQIFSISYSKPESAEVVKIFVPGVAREDFFKEENQTPITFQLLDKPNNESIGYLKINNFINGNEVKFKKELERIFRNLNKSQTAQLIVDLRGNTGGRDIYGAELFAYLTQKPFNYYDELLLKKPSKKYLKWYHKLKFNITPKDDEFYNYTSHQNLNLIQPKAANFSGMVYFLIDGGTFSAATELSTIAYAQERGVFIGEATGGGLSGNSSGFSVLENLPNSNIGVSIPAIWHQMAIGDLQETKAGLNPHYLVKPTVSDLVEQRDAVLDFTLQLIQNNNTTVSKNAGKFLVE